MSKRNTGEKKTNMPLAKIPTASIANSSSLESPTMCSCAAHPSSGAVGRKKRSYRLFRPRRLSICDFLVRHLATVSIMYIYISGRASIIERLSVFIVGYFLGDIYITGWRGFFFLDCAHHTTSTGVILSEKMGFRYICREGLLSIRPIGRILGASLASV